MKRALAFAVLVALLAPVAAVIVMACSTMPCCAEHQDRVSRPMECCQPTMCSSDTPGPQQQAVEKRTAQPAATATLAVTSVDETSPRNRSQHPETPTSPPRTTSVRLALIATLLI